MDTKDSIGAILRILVFTLVISSAFAQPIRLHPDNPHYYEFRGRPAVLVTSAEHYGAVLNLDFDYHKYLDALAKDKLNLTRIFSGAYREHPGDFQILGNTLAPAPGRFIAPWKEVAPGKWDLQQWNPAYFDRLKSFVREAEARGIAVEMTLFSAYYSSRRWEDCPLHISRNVNGVGKAAHGEALTLRDADLVEAQSAMVRKIVTELNAFDNVIYEICNEPYYGPATPDWQHHIAGVIEAAEKALPKRHLIAQNIANHETVVTEPDPLVSILHFHYARPPVAVEQNYGLKRVIGFDESGFDGTHESVYRIQGWDFLVAGGAHYNNLDYSFIVGKEDGSYAVPASNPGYGSATLRRQLSYLLDFMNSLDFVRMAPARDIIVAGVPDGASARVLAEAGRQYAIYIHHGRVMPRFRPQFVVDGRRQWIQLELRLPAGDYTAAWVNPQTGKTDRREEFTHSTGTRTLASPAYKEDIALRITARAK